MRVGLAGFIRCFCLSVWQKPQAVVNSRFGKNYSCLLNEYRIKDAKHLLVDKRYADKNVEEISSMVGFANRQSFYAAFYKNVGETPNGFRKRNMEK